MEIRPQKGPQEIALACPADILLYGGQAGGGKTYKLLMGHLRWHHHRAFRSIFFRRTTVHIRSPGGPWDEAGMMYPAVRARAIDHQLTYVFPSGSRAKFAHLEHETDVNNYQGSQIPLINFDELTHFTLKQFRYMLSRNRSIHGFPCKVKASCNPDPDSFVRKMIDWYIGEDGYAIKKRSGIVRWFIMHENEYIWGNSPGEVIFLGEQLGIPRQDIAPRSFSFVSASLEDNVKLMEKDPGYRARLLNLDKVERARLLHGNWNIRATAGAYFNRGYFEEVDHHPILLRIVRAWDRAATDEKDIHKVSKDPDWTACVKMGIGQDKKFYILDIERVRMSSGKVKEMILNYAKADGPRVTVRIFQDPGSAGKGEAEDMIKHLRGFHVHCTTVSKNKETLAKPLSAQAEFGNVKILKSCRNKEVFYSELEGFPDANHDDLVDGAASAFNFLNMDNVGQFGENMIQKGSSIIGNDSGENW